MDRVNQQGQAAGDGAYMDITWARQLWYDNLVPLRARGTGLVSPSITNTDGGLDWLSNWMNTLGDDAKPDAMAVHWYGTSPEDLRNWLEKVHNRFGKPVWLTEFACNVCLPLVLTTHTDGFRRISAPKAAQWTSFRLPRRQRR